MERQPVGVFRAVAAVRGCPASGAADHLGNPNAEQDLGFQDIYYLNRFTFDSADRWSHTCNIDYKVTINGNYFENVVGSGYEKGFVDGVFFGHVVRLGAGLMTLSPVMGTAFIRAYRLNDDTPSGPFMVESREHEDRIPSGFVYRSVRDKRKTSLISVDSIKTESPTVARIQDLAFLHTPKAGELVQMIRNYCAEYPCVGRSWSGNLRDFLSVDLENG